MDVGDMPLLMSSSSGTHGIFTLPPGILPEIKFFHEVKLTCSSHQFGAISCVNLLPATCTDGQS
jgi:hypothetical protein